MAHSSRPLSPHIGIYRQQITMIMSIMHRITGIGIYLGMALLAWWLVAAAWSDDALALVNMVMGNWLGRVVLVGFTWSLFNHMLGGLRHFIWDFGQGFSQRSRFALAWLTLFGGLAATALVWALVWWM